MSQPPKTPHQLVPELHLIAQLAPKWRRRFEAALSLLLENLDETLTWQEIAKACAISPYHFHRMFRLVFMETPGQYLNRARLHVAVNLLADDEQKSITEIAQTSGYSSSQALAKALKRVFNLTAGEIRSNIHKPRIQEELARKLGHPSENSLKPIEAELAQNMPIYEAQLPELALCTLEVKRPSLLNVERAWQKLGAPEGSEYYSFIQGSDDQNWLAWIEGDEDLPEKVGYLCDDASKVNLVIPASSYLVARATMSNEVAYISAWDAIYRYLMRHDIELPSQPWGLEIVHSEGTGAHPTADVSLHLSIDTEQRLAKQLT